MKSVTADAVPDEKRTARFVCVMVLGGPDSPLPRCTARGTFEGRLGRSLRGSGGFGYDPLFLVGPEFTQSASELTPDEKNCLSHRGMAARQLGNMLGSAGVVG